VSVLEKGLDKIKGVFRKNGHDMDFVEIRARADLEAGIATAKRAGAETWDPPTPTLEIKLACLERWYFFVRQKDPELILSGEEILRLEPADLSRREMREWYWGLRCEAARRILGIANSSYSKSVIKATMASEGLAHGLILLDPGTRESYEYVIKFLSD